MESAMEAMDAAGTYSYEELRAEMQKQMTAHTFDKAFRYLMNDATIYTPTHIAYFGVNEVTAGEKEPEVECEENSETTAVEEPPKAESEPGAPKEIEYADDTARYKALVDAYMSEVTEYTVFPKIPEVRAKLGMKHDEFDEMLFKLRDANFVGLSLADVSMLKSEEREKYLSDCVKDEHGYVYGRMYLDESFIMYVKGELEDEETEAPTDEPPPTYEERLREQMEQSLEFVKKHEAEVSRLRLELEEAEQALADSKCFYERHKAEYEELLNREEKCSA